MNTFQKIGALFVLLFIGLGVFGAQAVAAQSLDMVETFTYDGVDRVYRLFVPERVDTTVPIPLVFNIHGGGGDWEGAVASTGFDAVAEREGFAIVYPASVEGNWNDGRVIERTDPTIDDVGFLVALADYLTAEYNLDPIRVYATGISNGAMMSLRLACEASSTFAAVAAVAGSLPVELEPTCAPENPVAVALLHGDADPLVPYEGGDLSAPGDGTVIGVPDTVALWLEIDRCDPNEVATEALPDVARRDGTNITLTRYTECAADTQVHLYHINNGGHTWPGGVPNVRAALVGRVSYDINASEVIWDFFTHFSHDLAQ